MSGSYNWKMLRKSGEVTPVFFKFKFEGLYVRKRRYFPKNFKPFLIVLGLLLKLIVFINVFFVSGTGLFFFFLSFLIST